MTGLLIGYARVSTNDQDLTAQKIALIALGVTPEKTFIDQGLTGASRARPGLREALDACRDGDTLVVTKLDRLARSLRDAKDIVDELTRREVKLSIGGSTHCAFWGQREVTDSVGISIIPAPTRLASWNEFGTPAGRGPSRSQRSRRHSRR